MSVAALFATGLAWVLFVECFGGPAPADGWWCLGTDPKALPLRLLLCSLLVGLCVRIDDVVGYLDRVDGQRELPRDRRRTASVLGLLFVTGFALRVSDLGVPGLNWDEGMFAWVAANPTLTDVWHSVATRSPHPPLYFMLLHCIMEWSWDPFWLRLPSVFAGSALIGASFLLARRLAGTPSALLMAAFVTFAPTLVELSRVARNYAIAFVWIIAAAVFFVRFVQEQRWRDAVAASIVGLFAVLFHYCFLIVAAAQYVQLVWTGVLQRRPVSWWMRLAASQLPALAGIAALYVFHIRQLNPSVATNHETMFASVVTLVHNDWLAPMAGLWRYLAPLDLASACLVACIAGFGVLLARGMPIAFFVCLLPVISAYAFSWTGRYPLYGSRHAAYLFPFLFGPVTVFAVEIASSGRWLSRPRVVSSAPETGLAWARSPWRCRAGLAAVAFVMAWFIDSSMAEYRDPPLTAEGKPRVREFLKNYRRDDVDRAFAILEERARPEDVVLLTRQSLYDFRYHYHLRPRPTVSVGEDTEADFLAGPVPEKTGYLDSDGVRYYFSSIAGELFRWIDADTMVDAYEEIRDAYHLKRGGSLWVVRGGWDPSISQLFRNRFTRVPVDTNVKELTNDVLFRIEGGPLAQLCDLRRKIRADAAAKGVGAAVPRSP